MLLIARMSAPLQLSDYLTLNLRLVAGDAQTCGVGPKGVRPKASAAGPYTAAFCHACLPDEWDEAEVGAEAIFGIAGQFLAEKLLLAVNAEDKDPNRQGDGGQCNPRAQRQWSGEGEHGPASIHGVAKW